MVNKFSPNNTKSIDNLNKLQEQVVDLEKQVEEKDELINALFLFDLTNITPTINENNHTYKYQLPVTTELEHVDSKIPIFGDFTTESYNDIKIPYLIKLNGLKGIYFLDHMCDAETTIVSNVLGFFVDFQLDSRNFYSGQIETVWDTTQDTKSFKITFNYS